MKHLLEHLKMQLHKELDQMEAASRVADVDDRLRYMYEDMLDKTERALQRISAEERSTNRVVNENLGPETIGPAARNPFEDEIDRTPFDPVSPDSGPREGHPKWGMDSSLDGAGGYDPSAHPAGAEKDLPDALEGGKETISDFARNYKQLTGKDLTETVAKKVLGLEEYQGSLAEKIDAVSPDPDADLTEEVERVSEEDGTDLRDRFRDLADVDSNGEPAVESDDFSGLHESLEDLGVDVEGLRDVANVDELSREEIADLAFGRVLGNISGIEDADPQDLRKLAELAENRKHAQDVEDWTREGLIEWAVGERDYSSFNLDREEFIERVRNLLQDTRQTADGTIDMIDTFTNGLEDIIIEHTREIQEEVSDNE